MDNIILQLLTLIQYLYQQSCWLVQFICKYIPLKQWAFDGSLSPEYQKFKVDQSPIIIKHERYDYKELIRYFYKRYKKLIKPIVRKTPNVLFQQISPVLVVMLLTIISTIKRGCSFWQGMPVHGEEVYGEFPVYVV